MANAWLVPYYENNRVPSLSTSAGPVSLGQTGQWQSATQPNANSAAIQGCSCLWCSGPRQSDQLGLRTIEHQEPWPPSNAAFPYTNQALRRDEASDVSTVVNGQTQAPFVAPQAAENAGGGSLHVAADPLQAQTTASVRLDEAQVLEMSVAEGLRRLSRRYVNHPESLVNAVRLEPSTPGRFRVTIMMEIVEIGVL